MSIFIATAITFTLLLNIFPRQIKEAEQITLLGKKITTRRFYLRHQTVSIRLQYRQFSNETSILLKDFQKYSNNLITLK